MISEIITQLVSAATGLLAELGDVFTDVVALVYDSAAVELTELGTIIVATAGFALAWAGIRFVFSFVQKLLGRTRGGAR